MSQHLTYLEAVVTGLVQGVTELFPVSSLGHNVLIPALVGGSWANTLNVSAKGSPYLAFVVGLHVATALAMILFFWRDWLRIVRGFFSSLRKRSATTPDERLAWMIILATIPVGIVGALLQKVFVEGVRQARAGGGVPGHQRRHPAGQRADAAAREAAAAAGSASVPAGRPGRAERARPGGPRAGGSPGAGGPGRVAGPRAPGWPGPAWRPPQGVVSSSRGSSSGKGLTRATGRTTSGSAGQTGSRDRRARRAERAGGQPAGRAGQPG